MKQLWQQQPLGSPLAPAELYHQLMLISMPTPNPPWARASPGEPGSVQTASAAARRSRFMVFLPSSAKGAAPVGTPAERRPEPPAKSVRHATADASLNTPQARKSHEPRPSRRAQPSRTARGSQPNQGVDPPTFG